MFKWLFSFAKRREMALGAFVKAKKALEELVQDMYAYDRKLEAKKDKRNREIELLAERNAVDASIQMNVLENAESVRAQIQKIEAFLA